MTVASSRSIPFRNVIVRLYEPSEPEFELIYSIPSTPLTHCSMGTPMASATVFALAPGYDAETCTVGGEILGYWAIGRVLTVTIPIRIINIARTVANIGLSIKNLENIVEWG